MIAYLDSSALLKLLVTEEGTDRAVQLWNDATWKITSIVAYAELRSAVAAAVRSGRISLANGGRIRRLLEGCWAELNHIGLDEPLVAVAGDEAERHALKGYDAIHLATATRASADGDLVFVTWDRALADAALANGLAVAPSR